MTEKKFAFPFSNQSMGDRGMTLRDYFAAQAISGILLTDNPIMADTMATQAYFLADAMMKAREQ